MNKVTITGDIICDKEMLKHAKSKKEYDFSKMLEPLKDCFATSDEVIGVLETPIANSKYTNKTFSFNSPKALVKALKEIGYTALSLANNHILDRKERGIDDTINALKEYNIKYFGVDKKNFYINKKDCKICLIGYTDSTNYNINKNDNTKRINLLRPTTVLSKPQKINIKTIYHKINPEIRLKINKILNKNITPIVDKESKYDNLDDYITPLKESIKDSKEKKYYTIFYGHMGGQYNINPGNYVTKTTNKLEKYGSDSIILTHPHIVQTHSIDNNTMKFYSLGGIIISPTSNFVIWETLPQYSAILHYYFEKNKVIKATVEFLICIKDPKTYLKVYPFYDYYNIQNENSKKEIYLEFIKVYNRFFNKRLKKIKIKKEYIVVEEK